MKKVLYKVAKAILNKQGYKIALIKVQNGHIHIDGDKELLKYTDKEGFLWNKEPYIQRPLKVEPLVTLREYNNKMMATKPKDWIDILSEEAPIRRCTCNAKGPCREINEGALTDKDLKDLESLNPHGNSKVQKWEDYNNG
jgi:hypothetical protein